MKDKRLYIYAIYLLIIAFILTGISFSRFSTVIQNTGSENTEIPEISFSTWRMEHNGATVSLANLQPGNSRTIDIWVANWEESGETDLISGYDQSYTLELTTTGNLPLSFTLVKTNDSSPVAFSHPVANRYVSASQNFSSNVKETTGYTLTISWPSGTKSSNYQHEIDYLELKLLATQSGTE